MSEGVFGYLSVAAQNSYGTTNITSHEYIPFESESITDTIEELRPATLTGNFFEVDAVRGLESVAGDIQTVMHPEKSGLLFKAVFGQASSEASAGSGYYIHTFQPKNSNFGAGVALPPYTVQVYKDSGNAYQYTDSMLHNLEISLSTNDFLKLKVGVMSRVASLMTPVSGTAPSDVPFVFDQASINWGGSAFSDFETLSITFDNNVSGVSVLNATRQNAYFHRTDKMTVRMSGTVNFLNNSAYIDFKNYTRKAFSVYMKDTSVTSGNEFLLELPRLRLSNYSAPIGGSGRLSATFAATAEYHSGSGTACTITLTNSRSTY